MILVRGNLAKYSRIKNCRRSLCFLFRSSNNFVMGAIKPKKFIIGNLSAPHWSRISSRNPPDSPLQRREQVRELRKAHDSNHRNRYFAISVPLMRKSYFLLKAESLEQSASGFIAFCNMEPDSKVSSVGYDRHPPQAFRK